MKEEENGQFTLVESTPGERERKRERISILDMTCQPDSEISKERGEGLSEGWEGRERGGKKESWGVRQKDRMRERNRGR